MGIARAEGTPGSDAAAAADAALNAAFELGDRPETSLRVIDPSFTPQGPFDRDEALGIASRRFAAAIAVFSRLVASCTTHPDDERRRDAVERLIDRFLDANRDVPMQHDSLREELVGIKRRLRPANSPR